MATPIADYDLDHFSNSSEADKALLVRFFLKSMPDKGATAKEGRPIFKETEFIEIRTPGNRSDAVCRPARLDDKKRFSRHYEAFKQRLDMPEEGTPLSEWPLLTRSQVEELAYFNVKTVEQLANVPDNQAQQFMGFNKMRQQARQFIEASKQNVEAAQLKQELDKRDEQIAQLQSQLTELLDHVDVKGAAKSSEEAATAADSPKSRRRPRQKQPSDD